MVTSTLLFKITQSLFGAFLGQILPVLGMGIFMAFSMFNRNISMKVQVWMKTMDKKTLWSLYPSANSLTQRRSTENYILELNKFILFNKKKKETKL